MSTTAEHRVRRATATQAATVASLLDDFNREFDTPTPGVDVLTGRLRHLLGGDDLVALLVGQPAIGVAVVSFRLNNPSDGASGSATPYSKPRATWPASAVPTCWRSTLTVRTPTRAASTRPTGS